MNRLASASLLVATLATTLATGCASGPRPLFGAGMFPSTYHPPIGHNQLKGDGFIVTIDKMNNGGMATNFFAEITVRNVGKTTRQFDPADIELLVPATGMSYKHITKDKTSVTVPLGFNLMSVSTIKPGQMVAGTLWFPTPNYKAEAKAVQVTYRDATLDFPPALPESADDDVKGGIVGGVK